VTAATPREVLIETLARAIGRARVAVVGAQSPIPAAAALLAEHRAGGVLKIVILGSSSHYPFTDGGREMFDFAGQGRVDVFFLSGGQIDGQANINLVGAGGYPTSATRFPGSFGSAFLYFVVPRVILFREEHSRRVLVPKVDFISAPGTSPPGIYRPGGPSHLVTGRALFAFQRDQARFRLDSVHPGHSLDEVIENTGFEFDRADPLATTPAPDADSLALIRGPVQDRLAAIYPEFVHALAANQDML